MTAIIPKTEIDGSDIGLCVYVSREKKNANGFRFCKSMKVRGRTFFNAAPGRRWHVNKLKCDGITPPKDCPYKGVRR